MIRTNRANLEEIHLLCEPVPPPKNTLSYIHYFCGNTEIEEELKSREPQRTSLYKKTVALIRAYANIADEMEDAGYVISYWGNEDVGARRRYYTITDKGIELYEENIKD